MIDFIFISVQRPSFEQLMKRQGFMDSKGNPMPGADFDPIPGTPEYATGVPILAPVQPPQPPEGGGPPAMVQGYSTNIRVSGALEQAEIAGIPQTDEAGNLLPLRERTKLGLAMAVKGVEWTGNNTATGIADGGVTFIDPESIATQQRVWQ